MTDRQSCPLCGQDNACQATTDPNNCWCHKIEIPKELLERVPEKFKGLSCICRQCIDSFHQETGQEA